MKVIIAGSRKITNINYLYKALQASEFEVTEVVSGGAKGIDAMGEKWAKLHEVPIKRFNAQWTNLSHKDAKIKKRNDGTEYDLLAGFRRNQAMADYADALLAIWDGKSGGTQDMINKAIKGNLKIYLYDLTEKGLL